MTAIQIGRAAEHVGAAEHAVEGSAHAAQAPGAASFKGPTNAEIPPVGHGAASPRPVPSELLDLQTKLGQAADALDLIAICPGANIPASITAAAMRLGVGDFSGAALSMLGVIPGEKIVALAPRVIALLGKLAPNGAAAIERLGTAYVERFGTTITQSGDALPGEMGGHFAPIKSEVGLSETTARQSAQKVQREQAAVRKLLPDHLQSKVASLEAGWRIGSNKKEVWGLVVDPDTYQTIVHSSSSYTELVAAKRAAEAAGEFNTADRLRTVLDHAWESSRELRGMLDAIKAAYRKRGVAKDTQALADDFGLPLEVAAKLRSPGFILPHIDETIEHLRFDPQTGALTGAAQIVAPTVIRGS